MIDDPVAAELVRLADAIRMLNRAMLDVSAITNRPALSGHTGEFIASRIFDIDLHQSAATKGYDGVFRPTSPLAGRTVNIKWATRLESGIDLQDGLVDDYLVFAGPKPSRTDRHRLWIIDSVYLFEQALLVGSLKRAGIGIGVASSVKAEYWSEAMIYPDPVNQRLVLNDRQRPLIALFGSPGVNPLLQSGRTGDSGDS